MNKQDKGLLLKDLSARLPYGVKIETKEGVQVFDIKWLAINMANIKNPYLPYLRPMSSMTNEEKMYVNELIYDKDGLFLNPIPTWIINECDIDKYIDFCNSKHLDWRGLISKGLALPAPDGMYDFK